MGHHKTRDLLSSPSRVPSVVGQRMRDLREQLGLSQESVGVAIGIDESSSRARISRYELGVHEPPVPTARLIAGVLGAPLTYLYCEDDSIAALLLALHRLGPGERARRVRTFMGQLQAHCTTTTLATSPQHSEHVPTSSRSPALTAPVKFRRVTSRRQ